MRDPLPQHGPRSAHLPALLDDRARARVRPRAVSETSGTATQARASSDLVLQCSRVPWHMEGQQQVCEGRWTRLEEKWPHCQKGMRKQEHCGWTSFKTQSSQSENMIILCCALPYTVP
ncbi:hypothetical protein MHYP_G00209340 [Metynnis hypsauchen]